MYYVTYIKKWNTSGNKISFFYFDVLCNINTTSSLKCISSMFTTDVSFWVNA